MENYEVYGELRFDVSKEVEAESHQEAMQKAYEFLNSNSEIVSVILKDINGNQIEFALNKGALHNMNVDWQEVFGENE